MTKEEWLGSIFSFLHIFTKYLSALIWQLNLSFRQYLAIDNYFRKWDKGSVKIWTEFVGAWKSGFQKSILPIFGTMRFISKIRSVCIIQKTMLFFIYILTLMVIGIHNYNPIYHAIRVICNNSTVTIVYSWALKRQKWWKKMQKSTWSKYIAEPLSFGQIYHVVSNNFPFRFSWSAASEDTINSFGPGWDS